MRLLSILGASIGLIASYLAEGQSALGQGTPQTQLLIIRPDHPERRLVDVFRVAQDCIKDSAQVKGDFKEQVLKDACTVLQFVLDAQEDSLWLVTRNKTAVWTTTQREANRLLGTLDADGKKVYESNHGRQGEMALMMAKKFMSPAHLSAAARRYGQTRAGGEARLWLAGFAAAGYAPSPTTTVLRGTVVEVRDKADVWPTPTPGLAYVKFSPHTQLWLKSDADEKKSRARLPLKKGFGIHCSLRTLQFDVPALQTEADAVIIVHTP
jgi:hypothetical protein